MIKIGIGAGGWSKKYDPELESVAKKLGLSIHILMS